ncbi:hypothetical protein COW81_03390 [Candidatus Campbellbacteria bacterium CG22_combo_CG10-13_8_21_14_all_36_13]|uniref:Glycosyl transferase family 1 domain-containing protein n=1 Tax=Candidatus Campbellbacteria bacterium CG22_combo_CG10-13_8_21_14_all_36_13 TaxID=1974529 RepID=A0A2H0DZ76_9BACT|nr:MAG: hypothetical protein COW81_03390 [Candidatus Campbellbacteria bacterium CG22_combo_CG10-13_8_21_14_all_36_13]
MNDDLKNKEILQNTKDTSRKTSNGMKVLITCGIFEPDAGGPATYAPQLARELVSRGVEVDIITLSDNKSYDFDSKYSFKLTRVQRSNKLSNYTRMFFILLKNVKNYDLVYTLDWLTVGLPLSFASMIRRQKYVVRVGGGYIWERYLLMGGEPMSLKAFYEKGIYKQFPIFFYLIRFVFRHAHTVIFNSIIQRELFQEYYGLKPEKLDTIFNPIPSDISKVDRSDLKKEIVFAGRFIVMKNVENLIRGFAKADLQDYTLKLLGDGPILQDIHDLVFELGIEDRVEFLPRMRRSEMYTYIKDSRYLVLPSWTDIYPMQFYECLATGIPILLTKENYLIESSELSVQIDPHFVEDIAEKMLYLADETNYNEFVRKFDSIKVERGWTEITDQHMKIFEKISTRR